MSSKTEEPTSKNIVKKITGDLRVWNLLRVLAMVLVVIGSLLVVQKSGLNNGDTESGSDEIVTSTDRPDETKPGPNFKWRGRDSDPKKIYIDNIGVDAFVQKVGVDKNQQIAVPNNIHIAGWFLETAKIGDKGLSIIAGHVDGLTTGGVFKDLVNTKAGDIIKVELGDGKVINYEIIDNVTVPLSESAGILYSQDPKVESQLNLITCIGDYNRDTQTYDKRVIVSARKI